ncbi:hypothetical protein SAY86_024011 [Trapa natans]|uniref:Homeobox domain-containing protein n=1 Tax=Trapa natans TaxID=22666 RepID=A0AAN7RAT0_TRANT|nr:hypothetical protein SAY86_024011 [Trapa natans]
MADVDEACFTGLSLGLGLESYCPGNTTTTTTTGRKRKAARDSGINRPDEMCMMTLGLSFTPFPEVEEEEDSMTVGVHGPPSGLKSLPETCNSINGITTSNNDGSNLDGSRKKLRLSKDQSALLEDSFKIHRTLTQANKQTLADKLNLKPRQVEVWFQNRRARSKLKQIESEFERLKKNCESLTQRNQRLERELYELRSMRDQRSVGYASRIPDQDPAASSLCPSCGKITGGSYS